MALCMAEALVTSGGWDAAAVMDAWVAWLDSAHLSSNGRFIDVGISTRSALQAWKKSRDVSDACNSDAGNKRGSNGGLMRLAPLPIYLAAAQPTGSASFAAAVAACGASCSLTHGHPAAIDSCRYLGALLLGALAGESKSRLLSPLYEPEGVNGLWDGDRALCAEVELVARGSFWRVSPSGDAFSPRSLEAALWAFAHSSTFDEGATLVANLGGDADTTAAIYGQLAGAHYGEAALPATWESQLFFPHVRAAPPHLSRVPRPCSSRLSYAPQPRASATCPSHALLPAAPLPQLPRPPTRAHALLPMSAPAASPCAVAALRRRRLTQRRRVRRASDRRERCDHGLSTPAAAPCAARARLHHGHRTPQPRSWPAAMLARRIPFRCRLRGGD